MNLLKRISIVLSATLFLWGCSDSDEPVNEMNDSLSLSTNEIKINGLGGEVAVTVTSSDDWRLARHIRLGTPISYIRKKWRRSYIHH